MITEHIKNLNSSYETVKLEEKPCDKRYQYRMAATGYIKSILNNSMRYIDGTAYIYYDITSLQSVGRLFAKKKLDRDWVLRLFSDIKSLREELEAYLLNIDNVYFAPEEIYRNLYDNSFVFMYVPYLDEDNHFGKLLEYIIEKMDYEDEELVECIYKVYESYEEYGNAYLDGRIYEDIKALKATKENVSAFDGSVEYVNPTEDYYIEDTTEDFVVSEKNKKKKGILSIFERRAEKERKKREMYRQRLKIEMEGLAVAEEVVYKDVEEVYEPEDGEDEESYGKTVFISDADIVRERGLYSENDRLLSKLSGEDVTIGKIKGEADIVMSDTSVSRIHARVICEDGEYYIEDMNSTNGTYKNNLKLKPYERRRLMPDDEIRLGNATIIYR